MKLWCLALSFTGLVHAAQPAARSAWPEPAADALRAWGAAAAPAPAPAPPRRTAAAPPAAVPASAPPSAPAPAWRFVGRITEAGSVRAMLLTQHQLRVVAEQEALDADWRVERIGEQGVELLWLPGAQRVRLSWAAP